MEIEKIVEVPEIIEKEIIFDDENKIRQLEEELRLLEIEKSKIKYVELVPTGFA